MCLTLVAAQDEFLELHSYYSYVYILYPTLETITYAESDSGSHWPTERPKTQIGPAARFLKEITVKRKIIKLR